MTNKKHSKKRGFTLIEMLIVIVIIGILAAYLIPRISSAQGKARDVAREADINQITQALVSYSLAKGKFPEATNGCVKDLEDTLVEGGYISSISSDPSKKPGLFCNGGESYGYWTNGDHFAIIADLDDYENANICENTEAADGEDITDTITTFASQLGTVDNNVKGGYVSNSDATNTNFFDAKKSVGKIGCTNSSTKGYYVYTY